MKSWPVVWLAPGSQRMGLLFYLLGIYSCTSLHYCSKKKDLCFLQCYLLSHKKAKQKSGAQLGIHYLLPLPISVTQALEKENKLDLAEA